MFIYLFLFVAVFVIAFFAYAKYGISDEDIARIKREALAKKSNNNTTSSDYSRGQEDGIDDAIHGEAPFALGGSSDKREALAKKSNNNTTSSDYSRGQEDGIDDAIHGEAPFALGGSSDYQKGYDSDASWEMHEAMHHDGLGF